MGCPGTGGRVLNELIKIEVKEGKETVNARELHSFLENRRDFSAWIKARVIRYGFIEGVDFTNDTIVVRGSTFKEYFISVDMAKELSMVENNLKGKAARQYFIRCETFAKKAYKKALEARTAGKITRKTLTDEIRDSGENERMHGHGYSTYTRLAYKLTGIKECDRDSLDDDSLERLDLIEDMIRVHVKAGQEYQAVKDALAPIFANITEEME